MNKITTFFKLLTLLLVLTISAKAQLPDGSYAQNFTFKDLNGNVQDLYTYLNQGKTVFIDVSAAWCGPCWSYHNSGSLEALWAAHGPAGATGVRSNTTNDVMVLFIEGEATNTHAQLYGPAASTGSAATTTQGDWVTGTYYPIIDTTGTLLTNFKTNYSIAYFPTIYKICKDRLVTEVGQLDSNALYASVGSCPSYGPSSTTDAKMVNTTKSAAWYCGSAPMSATVKFQNYSSTNYLSNVTINAKSGSTVIGTQAWTGNLAPYLVTSQSISFPATSGEVTFEVIASNDANNSNNKDTSSFTSYNSSNVLTLPYSDNLNSTPSSNYGYGNSTDYEGLFFHFDPSTLTTFVGPDGNKSGVFVVDFYNAASGKSGTMVLGNFNAAGKYVSVSFDYAHAGYDGGEADMLQTVYSSDCGTTWNVLNTLSGTSFETGTATQSNYIPSASTQWKKSSTYFLGTTNNDLVGIKATSDYGNYAWIDNINIYLTPAATSTFSKNVSLKIYPNPASDILNLEINNSDNLEFEIQITDITGKILESKNIGNNKSNVIDIKNLANDQYLLQLISKEGTVIKPFIKK